MTTKESHKHDYTELHRVPMAIGITEVHRANPLWFSVHPPDLLCVSSLSGYQLFIFHFFV
jgi:hypothetical protein